MRTQVVVPTYNNLTELKRCLEALERQTTTDFSVLVCVDGSTDGTVRHLRESGRPFELAVVEHPDRTNHGRAAARNLALPRLSAPITLLLDSDMRLAPDGLAHHVELIETRDCVSIGDVAYDNAAANVWARYLAGRGVNKLEPGAIARPLDFVTANTALRTEHLLALNGFDESLRGYGGEDTELAMRLESRAVQFIFNAAALAVTTEAKTTAQGLAQLDQFARTNLRTLRRRHPLGPAPFWIDRAESTRRRDRLLRLLLNPLSDRIADVLLPRVPFGLQRQILNYKVIRTVYRAYAEAGR